MCFNLIWYRYAEPQSKCAIKLNIFIHLFLQFQKMTVAIIFLTKMVFLFIFKMKRNLENSMWWGKLNFGKLKGMWVRYFSFSDVSSLNKVICDKRIMGLLGYLQNLCDVCNNNWDDYCMLMYISFSLFQAVVVGVSKMESHFSMTYGS